MIGDYIEIWDEDDEGVFDTFIELQSHWDADGIKQEFEMMPNSQLTFILAYKGRYDDYDFGGNTQNAFSLKVEGASEVLVNGVAAQPDGNSLSHSFMADDDPEADPLPYENWSFASATITAGPEATNNDGSVDLTLSLVPDELTDDLGDEVTYGGFVQLLKVDVMTAVEGSSGIDNLETATELKVAKMEDSLTQDNELDIDLDSDRFYVRVPGLQNSNSVSVILSTVDNVDSSYNDAPTEIGLNWNSTISSWISPSLILTDKFDDGLPFEYGEDLIFDNEKNDRTHMIQLGGSVKIERLIIDDVDIPLSNLKTSVPVEKTVDVSVIIFSTSNTTKPEVEVLWKKAQERYAQVGLEVNYSIVDGVSLPAGVDVSDGLEIATSGEGDVVSIGDEARLIIDQNGTNSSETDIHAFHFGPSFSTNGITVSAKAVAIFPNASVFSDASNDGYRNNIFISENTDSLIAAHELGHVLTNNGHYGEQYPNPTPGAHKIERNLMLPDSVSGIPDNSLTGPKRLTEGQELMIHSNSLVN